MNSNRLRPDELPAVVERVRGDVSRRRFMLDDVQLQLARISQPTPPWIDKSAYSVNDFLRLQDAEFVTQAYRSLLLREPDPAGHQQYSQDLRSGRRSKSEVLGRIRYSAEGRKAGIRIDGLVLSFALDTVKRIPVFGHFIGICQYVLCLPNLVKNHKRLEAIVFTRDAELRAGAARDQKNFRFAVSTLSDALATQSRNTASRDDLAASARSAHDEMETLAAKVLMLRSEIERENAERVAQLERAKEAAWEEKHSLDAFYASFEDQFRGTREKIKQLATANLPIVRAVDAGKPEAPVLDIGSGRGEWLEVLKENGLTARGLDVNAVIVARSRALDLEVIEGDALEYLRSLPSNALGAVTGFHVIEHVPFRQLVAMLDEVLRALRPGGVALFETPNPENLLVGACNFWKDPTHLKPLPPDMMRFVFEARGFTGVEIERRHPVSSDRHFSSGDLPLRSRLNELLNGWQDYAIVAYKQ